MSAHDKMDIATPFQYTTLDPERHEIRLIKLEKASSGPIQSSMIVQSLDQQTTIPYEAISYVWGDPSKSERILIADSHITITRSAYEVLDRLRRVSHQYLWIDAICINQDDDTERGHQVQQMGRIYASARRVIFHLGQGTVDTDLLMRGLHIAQKVHRKQRRGPSSEEREHNTQIEWEMGQKQLRRKYLNTIQRQRGALYDLFGRPWFERVWIIQEVSNARDGIVCCGDWAVPCTIFVMAPRFLDVQVTQHCRSIIEAMPTSSRRGSRLNYNAGLSLCSLLQKFRGAKASLQCDRIYALLGLLEDTESHSLRVDYTMPDEDLVRHTAAHICKCNVASLQQSVAMPIEGFLSGLDTLRQRVFSQLVQSTQTDAYHDMLRMLQSKPRGFEITPSILQDATKNRTHGGQMLKALVEEAPNCYKDATLVESAARNPGQGLALIEILSNLQADIELTDSLANAIISNRLQGQSIAQWFEKRRKALAIPPNQVLTDFLKGGGPWSMVFSYFLQCNAPLRIPQGTLITAIIKHTDGTDKYTKFLDTGDWHVIAEPMLLALAESHSISITPLVVILRYLARTGELRHEIVLASFMNGGQNTSQYLEAFEQFHDADAMASTIRSSHDMARWQFLRAKVPMEDASDPDEKITILDAGQPALWWAIIRENARLARALIEKGASINVKSVNFGSPLLFATTASNVEMVKLCLLHGADPRAGMVDWLHGLEPLGTAAHIGDTEVLGLLLDHSGLDTNTILKCGCALVHHAMASRMLAALKLFRARGLQVDSLDWYRGGCYVAHQRICSTLLHARSLRLQWWDLSIMPTNTEGEIIDYLLEDLSQESLERLLYLATSQQDHRMVRALFHKGVSRRR